MPAKTELDATDRRILRILGQDGRASYQAVADEVGLSRPAIMERVKRLEEAGYIRGYRVQLDRGKVGLPVTAFVAVRYGSSDYVGDEPRMREMEKHPGVLECHHIAGDDCYILKVVAHELKGKALIAYLIVCVFWGSTYLAIKVGVTELPPFLFAGLRFLVAGLILLAVARALGDPLPRKNDWRTLTIVGLLLLAGGNAFVVWSEQYIGSGIASIFVVTVAMWTALIDAIIPGGSSELNWRVVAGLLLGFLGTLLLVGATPAEILAADKRGPLALTMASASWSLGTVYAKRHPTQASPYMGAAFQMIVGGGAVALVGTMLGEWASWHLSTRGIGAIAYLVIFGSILGYSAYSYALRHASATIVGTYAYVNPVIAVLLGWLLLHEPVGTRTLVAMGWIQFSMKHRRIGGSADGRVESAATIRPSDHPAIRPEPEAST